MTTEMATNGDQAVDMTSLKKGFSIGKMKRCRNGHAMAFRMASKPFQWLELICERY